MSEVFYRFAPFIQDYIYRSGWENLRGVQLEAARVLFETDSNLLLSSSTASGKTEAAFFPIISMLHEEPPSSFGALYIAPLKSLINDQFLRLDELLDLSGIPVFHWHGDVAASHKNKAMKNPAGILQITPESLEGMLMNRSNDVIRMFSDLRFIVIDEIHIMTGTDRGNQIICQLMRLARLIGHTPRRIGLSATIGDPELAAQWLGAGTGRETEAPPPEQTRTKWRLGVEHFFIQNDAADQSDGLNAKRSPEPEEDGIAELDPGYEYIYDCVKDKKCIVFSNSREETEYVTATLRQIAEHRGERDIFMIHHGNLSAAIREEAELKLKDDDIHSVTCATVTLELGIDIGRLERVVQLDSPNSVQSLLQRIGRSGRRGNPPEMMMVFREEDFLPNTPLPQMIPWGFLRAIAIIQLYLEERFIEPPRIKKMPLSLMFQQTLSILASSGSLSLKALAGRVMSLPPFAHITKEHYKTLLLSMLQNDYIEMTEEKECIIGLRGERLINSFKFLAVFKDSEDYTVRCESDEIGTITAPPPVGDRFALAGRVWEVEELDIPRKLIYVKPVRGKMEIEWPGDYGEIHTRILERMKQVLTEDTVYPYLKRNARQRLEVVRNLARNTGMLERSLVHLGGYTWCLFPWLGTRSFRTLRKFIARNGGEAKISGLEFDGCYYMTFKMEKGDDYRLIRRLCDKIGAEGIDKSALVGGNESPVFEKYDDCIPSELLRKAYTVDRLRTDEIMIRLPQILAEYEQ
ncbi:MAG: DEAD/DEAH box helicase [Eubacteriales bacterium]|nr:DEAD/DEAH box helicase [Eubacteriales bacterium]